MKRSVQAGLALCLPPTLAAQDDRTVDVNDAQSQLNKTRVQRVAKPKSREEVLSLIRQVAKRAFCNSASAGHP